jgi:hypothetical protein
MNSCHTLLEWTEGPYWEVARLVEVALGEQFNGVNSQNNNHQVYLLPDELQCGWDGLGYIDCTHTNNCKTFIRKGPDAGGKQTLAHELAHNLGQHHAAVDRDDDGGVEDEYGDASCIMGIAPYWRSWNTPHRVQAGWIPASDMVDLVRPTTAECTAAKAAGSTTATTTRVLKLTSLHTKPTPNTDDIAVARIERAGGGHYYLGFRARQGYDATLPITTGDRVHMHYLPNDAVGNTASEKSSRLVAMVGVGSGKVAFNAGFSLEVVKVVGDVATLTVDLCTDPPAQSGGAGTAGDLGACFGVTVR